MVAIASQITSLMIVYSIVYSDAKQRKHQSSASLAFVRGIHRGRRIPRTNGQLRGKCFHLMTSLWSISRSLSCVLTMIACFQFAKDDWLSHITQRGKCHLRHTSHFLGKNITTGSWFNIKMSSYHYRKSYYGDKTVVKSSYLHNGISYTGKMSSLYWTSPRSYNSSTRLI